MDTASAIIVFVFFFSIIGTVFHGSGQPGGFDSSSQQIVTSSGISLPSSGFLSGAFGAEPALQAFIQQYRNRLGQEGGKRVVDSILKYSQEFDVNPRLVAALIARESSFNPQAVSPTGALGLGQLLPSTAASMDVTDAFNIEQNIRGTTRYIKMQLDRWSGEPEQVALALASYFQGYNAVRRLGGYYVKTQSYIQDIIQLANSI